MTSQLTTLDAKMLEDMADALDDAPSLKDLAEALRNQQLAEAAKQARELAEKAPAVGDRCVGWESVRRSRTRIPPEPLSEGAPSADLISKVEIRCTRKLGQGVDSSRGLANLKVWNLEDRPRRCRD